MSNDIGFLCSMSISIFIFINLSNKLGWSEKLWETIDLKFKINPSYKNSLAIFIAITFPMIILVLVETLGVDRPIARIIHGISIGFAVSLMPIVKDNRGGLIGKYIRNRRKGTN